jgi:hypothetical protein
MDKQNEHPPAGERIAKVIARAGLASRREAEAWIAAGRVAVNGKLVASPALNVGARDRIEVDGQPLPMRERTRLFLYHKQRGLLTTHADPGGRPTIFSVLPKELPRLISVGRLDLNTEGLLLLTNDGGLAHTWPASDDQHLGCERQTDSLLLSVGELQTATLLHPWESFVGVDPRPRKDAICQLLQALAMSFDPFVMESG